MIAFADILADLADLRNCDYITPSQYRKAREFARKNQRELCRMQLRVAVDYCLDGVM